MSDSGLGSQQEMHVPAIRIQGVFKSFEGHPVLENVSLEMKKGLTHVLVGSSGSGKSTLLRLILGLCDADTGKIWVQGTESCLANQTIIASKVGYVVQEGGLFPHLTAARNISLVAKLRRWSKGKIQSRLAELSDLAGLDKSLLDRYPHQLSGGQRQRVGLLRALMLDPQILFLDEPLGALDPLIRSALQSELKDIFSRLQKTVVLVTHDLGEAAFLGHKVSLFHQGRVIQTGRLIDLVEKPQNPFVTEFLRAQRPAPELKAIQ